MDMDILGHRHVWTWTYMDIDICGHGHIWARTHMDIYIFVYHFIHIPEYIPYIFLNIYSETWGSHSTGIIVPVLCEYTCEYTFHAVREVRYLRGKRFLLNNLIESRVRSPPVDGVD